MATTDAARIWGFDRLRCDEIFSVVLEEGLPPLVGALAPRVPKMTNQIGASGCVWENVLTSLFMYVDVRVRTLAQSHDQR